MLALILNGTDQSEETAALVDLVENGANLLRAVDCLLRDIHTLSGVSGECISKGANQTQRVGGEEKT